MQSSFKRWGRWTSLAGLVSVMVCHADDSLSRSTPPNRAYYLPGKHVYKTSCQPCHGERGKGDGELVTPDWEVFPRDLSKGEFKYRSTPYGKLPTNADIHRTIKHGIAGSAMPTFHNMTERDISVVTEYIKYFSRSWRDASNHANAIPLPPKPNHLESKDQRLEAIAAGKILFTQVCAPCHGEQGEGGGVAAKGMVDSDGNPIQPANLRVPLGCGDRPEDILRTLMTGMTGTPMPAFGEALTPEQAWQIVMLLQTWRHSEE